MRAALFSLVFGATSLLAYYQFAPGRIDHHNVMIASTLSAALIVWAWPRDVRLWRWSGVLCAVALAVGYEALAPVFLIAGLVAAWGLVDREKAREVEAFVVGLAVTLAAVQVATVAPSRWMTIYCDALSLNLVVLAACGGAGYVAVVRNPAWSWTKRIAVLCVAGGAGITGFGWLEPACLAGPMGQVPADVGAAWLAQVDETKSVLREFLRGEITGTIAPVLIFAAGIAVGAIAFARSTNASDRFYLAAAAGFVVLGLWQMKYIAYASLILVPGIAVFAARLQPFGSLSGPVVTASAMVMLNQFTLFTLAGILRPAAAPAAVATAPANTTAREVQAPSPQLACSRGDALRALGAAPSGLVVTHNDIGAHLAAATYHRALSGPYHRIPRAIMTNGEILAAKDAGAAGRLLAREQVDYVLTCEPMDKAQLARPGWSGSLLATLAANQPPAFLKPVALPDAPLYRLWRVDRQHLPQP